MDPILSGILGVLIGGFIGHRFALGRDKRKEFNDCISPLREKLIHQMATLSSRNYEHGIVDNEITKLVAVLGEAKTKQISLAYKKYSEARKTSAPIFSELIHINIILLFHYFMSFHLGENAAFVPRLV